MQRVKFCSMCNSKFDCQLSHLCDDGRVLKRQLIIWQSLQRPLGRLNRVHQHVDHVQGVGVGDVAVLEEALPSLEEALAKFLNRGESRVHEIVFTNLQARKEVTQVHDMGLLL